MRFLGFHSDRLRLSRYALAGSALTALLLTSAARPQSTAPARPAASISASASQQDARNQQGLTQLIVAASAGDVSSVKTLLAAGAGVDATDANGRTALIVAIQNKQPEVARALVAAGANLNLEARYIGSPLNVAENDGDTEMAAMLQAAGAHSTGKSVGDTVCVLPWGGQGYCGRVKVFTVRSVQLDVTRIVGCAGGCAAREECSAANPVGGVNGLHLGEQIAVPSWCLTSTGVKRD